MNEFSLFTKKTFWPNESSWNLRKWIQLGKWGRCTWKNIKNISLFFFSNFDLQKSWGCWILLANPEHFVKDFPTNFRAVRVPPWSPNLRKNITFHLGALLSANRPHFSSWIHFWRFQRDWTRVDKDMKHFIFCLHFLTKLQGTCWELVNF